MKRTTRWTVLAVVAAFAATVLIPGAALADGASRQKNKNMWRNLAIGAAAVAGYGLLKHNSTATLLGAAGAAYSANRYEQDRRSQDANARARARYHRIRSERSYRGGERYYRRGGPPYGHAYGHERSRAHHHWDRDDD